MKLLANEPPWVCRVIANAKFVDQMSFGDPASMVLLAHLTRLTQ